MEDAWDDLFNMPLDHPDTLREAARLMNPDVDVDGLEDDELLFYII